MGRASRTRQDGTRQQKIAAQRAAARSTRVRKQLFLAAGSIAVVAVVVVALVLVKATSDPGPAAAKSEGPTGAALRSLVSDVTSVPASVLDRVGTGSLGSALTRVSGPPLASGGKPEVLYIGANFCPYCAAERWPMIIALSRFGTFSGLSTIHSSSTDVPADVPTFTFYGSRYTSRYVSFVPVEETTNYRVGNSTSQSAPYATLQVPTAAEQALINRYDPGTGGQDGSIPFIDVGNRYAEVGNLLPYGPQDLQGKTWSQVAAALRDPSSPIAQGADASANYLTAGICELTGNQPAAACTAAIRTLEPRL
jgi:thiol-disulfide isomerase/thioredoxin